MGYEYIIEADMSDRGRWNCLIERLTQPPQCNASFRAEVIEGGVYFCEDSRSPESAVALRKLIDEALTQRPFVVIREA